MKNNSLIPCTIQKQVAFLTIDRQIADPGDFHELSTAVSDICAEIAAREDIHVVVINPHGESISFSQTVNNETVLSLAELPGGDRLNAANMIASLPQPVLLGTAGEVRGLGLELALACDMRVAADDSRFAMTHLLAGDIPCWGGSQRLARLVGRGKALEMLLTAEDVDAGEALRIGLVNKVFEKERLQSALEVMALQMAAKGPIALRYAKEAVHHGLDLSIAQGLRLEGDLYFLLHTSNDRVEGIQAFQQKRAAKFEGR